MISKSKSLITLTDINVQSNQPEIAISMTSGLHTLKAVTVGQNLWETIGFLACELTMAEPAIRDRVVNRPEELVPYFRFDIDSDLRMKMAGQYSELGDCDLVRMNENLINGFDKVNGNNAVSQSVGVANLVVGISSGKFSLEDEPKKQTKDPIAKLVGVLFDNKAWDVDSQGIEVIEGKLSELGEDIDFNTCSAVGNVFVEGRIGKLGIRIFKANNIQVYIGWGTEFPDRPEVFQIYDRDKLTQRLYDAVDDLSQLSCLITRLGIHMDT